MASHTAVAVPRVALDLDEAAEAAGVSRETIRKAIQAGELRAKRSGKNKDGDGTGKYLVSVTSLTAWFDGLVDA